MNSNWSYSPETPNLGEIRQFLEPCDLEIWRMTLKNNRAPLLCYFKLYASFRSHRWIRAGITVRKRPIWVKIEDFFSRVTLQFDVWPWKTIGHLFYSSCTKANLRDLIAATGLVILLKLDLNRRFFCPCDLEIWWMTPQKIGHLFYATLNFLHHFAAIGEYKLELQSGNAQSGSNLTLFRAVWPWNLTDDLQKQ